MKKNLTTGILFLVLASVAAYFYFNRGSGTIKKELIDFAVKDTASITKIFMADKGGRTILLDRMAPDLWRLNNQYEARQDAVETLLATIHSVKVKAPINQSSFEQIVKNIASNSIKVEIYQGGEKPTKVYYVGGANQLHSGTNMLMEGSSRPFVMHIEGFHGFINPRYFTNVNDWRSTRLFTYSKGEIARLEVKFNKEPSRSVAIDVHENGHDLAMTRLEDGSPIVPFDTLVAHQYLAQYKKIHFEGFEETKTDSFIDSIRSSTPKDVFTITDRAGNVTELKTFLKPVKEGAEDLEGNPIEYDADRMYGVINDSEFVIIQYHVFDPLTGGIKHFTKP